MQPVEKAPINLAPDRACSLARVLAIVPDAWTFMVLRATFLGAHRFGVIRDHLHIPRNLLAARLHRLTESGVLVRRPVAGQPRRLEYRVTEKGAGLYAVALMLQRWGDRWLAGPEGPPIVVRHLPCGQVLVPMMTCAACGKVAALGDIEFCDGPGAGPEKSGQEHRRQRMSDPALYERGGASSIARALKVVGDRWSFFIVRDAMYGLTRFEEFCRSLGIARNILSDRLGKLVEYGVMARVGYSTRPPRFEYCLTEEGRDLFPVILTLIDWGDRQLEQPAGAPVAMTHLACGKPFRPAVACSYCARPVTLEGVEYVAGLTGVEKWDAYIR
jgi:DNA-binding HxlR family transcriptional regulator